MWIRGEGPSSDSWFQNMEERGRKKERYSESESESHEVRNPSSKRLWVLGGRKGPIADGWRGILTFHKGDEKYLQKAEVVK